MKIVSVVAVVFVCSCVPTITEGGAAVRVVSHYEQIKGCKLVGQVRGESSAGVFFGEGAGGTDLSDTFSEREAKEAAAKIGANFVLRQGGTSGVSASFAGDAYACLSASNIDFTVRPMSAREADAFGYLPEQGIIIDDLADDGIAFAAGLRRYDLLLRANGSPLTSERDLRGAFASFGEVEIEALREKTRVTIRITLQR